MNRPDIDKHERQALRYVGKHWSGTQAKWLRQLELIKYIRYLEEKLSNETD